MDRAPGNRSRTTLAPAVVAVAFVATVLGSLWYQSQPPASRAQPPVAIAESASIIPAPSLPTRAAQPAEVDAFLAFAERAAPDELPLSHDYTAEGLRLLAAALAARSQPLAAQVRSIDEAADMLQADSRSLQHARIARDAFLAAAQALGSSRAGFAAKALDADAPMRSQKARVERFFYEAAAALSERSRPDNA